MAISRRVPRVVVLNGYIYVVGGEHESMSLACVECYDPQSNYWTPITKMIIERCEFGLCVWNGYMYAIGGWVGSEQDGMGDSIEHYNPQTNVWTVIESVLPQPRFSMGIVLYEGLIYIVGGYTECQQYSKEFLSFNPLTGEWNTLPPMSVARSEIGVAILDDCLYVVGGTNRSDIVCLVEKYSFKEEKWTMMPPMSVARSAPAVVSVNHLLYVIGGYQTTEKTFYRTKFALALVECFNPLTNEWCDCPPLPESRAEAGAVAL